MCVDTVGEKGAKGDCSQDRHIQTVKERTIVLTSARLPALLPAACCPLLLTCPASALLHPHSAGQWDNSLELVKWGLDWLVKAHVKASDTPADNAFVGQVRGGMDPAHRVLETTL